MCDDGERESVPCGLNGRGDQSRTCANGRWPALSACEDPDVCVDRAEQSEPCGRNGAGRQTRSCSRGQWSVLSACADPDACVNGTEEPRACGLNQRGARTRSCLGGQWSALGPCVDPDVCTDGATASEACGAGGAGQRTRSCQAGRWAAWGQCQEHAVRCDPAGDAHCRTCTDALEANDRTVDAPAIGPGTIVDLTVCTDVDLRDYYRVDVAEATAFRVVASWAVPPIESRAEVAMVDATGHTIGNALFSRTDRRGYAQTSGVLPAAGTYYVRVTARQIEVAYELEVELDTLLLCGDRPEGPDCVDCSDRLDGNDSIAHAFPIEAGRAYGDLEVCFDTQDWFAVDVPVTSMVEARLQASVFTDSPSAWIHDAGGNALNPGGGGSGQGDYHTLPVRIVGPSTAFVEVRTYNDAVRYELTVVVEPEPVYQCDDGVDNDADGAVDADDRGCTGPGDDSEANAPNARPVCANGVDDDDDGLTDYPQDPECAAAGGLSEAHDCAEGALVVAVDETGSHAVSTLARADLLHAQCGGGNTGGEVVFAVRLGAATRVVAETTQASYDTVLSLRESCSDEASETACNDDIATGNRLSRLERVLPAGTHYVILDGYGGSMGDATVQFTLTPP